ncbi:MAG: hypothetical protein Kow00121_32330 [Elainellaceae cyanobacterium]
MLPPIVNEGDCHPFKFWFHNKIQDGMVYRNELFYRWQTVPDSDRVRLYRRACQLVQNSQDSVVVTATTQQYSIWISLRNPCLSRMVAAQAVLPNKGLSSKTEWAIGVEDASI